MTHIRTVALIVAFLMGFLAVAAGATPTIGVLSKIIRDVSLRPSGLEWEKATRGQALTSGDMLRTGVKSIALIKLKDNSLLRLREQSEITVTGTLDGRSFSKSISVQRGVVGFNVQKQREGEAFRFSSPTSVASVRGTMGAWAIGDADTLVVVEGLVQITNTVSNETADIPAGFTAVSRPDGSLERRESTAGERGFADEAGRTGDLQRQLRIDLKDQNGQHKDLIIDYKEE